MKICAKINPKNEPKINVWAIRGPTFEVLDAFLRSLIFNEFSVGKKCAKNAPQATQGEPKARPRRPKEGPSGAQKLYLRRGPGPKVLQRGKEFLRRLRGTMMPTSKTYAKFQQTAHRIYLTRTWRAGRHGADL